MGFKISWLGFKGLSKEQILDRVGLRDTGEPDEANEAPFSIAEIPHGWTILFTNDTLYAGAEKIIALSMGAQVVACQVHEGVMFSAAYAAENGKLIWSVSHNSENGVYDLSIDGNPPTSSEGLKARLTREQDEAGGSDADVDYLFDVPVELAASIADYRHDRWQFDWGEPRFTALKS
jgi:hypothetical protein